MECAVFLKWISRFYLSFWVVWLQCTLQLYLYLFYLTWLLFLSLYICFFKKLFFCPILSIPSFWDSNYIFVHLFLYDPTCHKASIGLFLVFSSFSPDWIFSYCSIFNFPNSSSYHLPSLLSQSSQLLISDILFFSAPKFLVFFLRFPPRFLICLFITIIIFTSYPQVWL